VSATFQKKDDKLIVTIEGRLDTLNAPQIIENLKQHLKGFDGDVVFNFEKLEYMTSAGLQVLLVASQDRNEQGKSVYVYKPAKIVNYVMDVSGFWSFIKRADSLP